MNDERNNCELGNGNNLKGCWESSFMLKKVDKLNF